MTGPAGDPTAAGAQGADPSVRRLGPLWHVGIVVDDLDAATAGLAATLGLLYSSVQEQEVTVALGPNALHGAPGLAAAASPGGAVGGVAGADGGSRAASGCPTQSGRVRWVATSGEAPDWELIQAADGLWSTGHTHGEALHHLAYWSDDLEADVARLTAAGHTLEAAGHDGDGRVRFVYLIAPGGIRLELGARYTQQAWDAWVAGRDYGLEIA